MESTPDKLVSMSYACERFDVTDKTVRRWIADGLLTGWRVGPRLIRLDKSEVDNMLTRIEAAS